MTCVDDDSQAANTSGGIQMTRATLKEQEREQFDAAIRLRAIEVDGDPVEQESLDFVFNLRDGRRIGLEIVRALNEEIASGRGTRSRIKRQVFDALMAAGLNAGVNVRLNEHTAGWLNSSTAIRRLARRMNPRAPRNQVAGRGTGSRRAC